MSFDRCRQLALEALRSRHGLEPEALPVPTRAGAHGQWAFIIDNAAPSSSPGQDAEASVFTSRQLTC
eukprot:1115476-Rhodomonas_salina.1